MSANALLPPDAPTVGDPRLADPQWWETLWSQLDPSDDRDPEGKDRKQPSSVRSNTARMPPATAAQWIYWLRRLDAEPIGAAYTTQGFLRGLTVLRRFPTIPTEALARWLQWHTAPAAARAARSLDRGSQDTAWSQLPQTTQREIFDDITQIIPQVPYPGTLIATLLAHLPPDLLELSPQGWEALIARCIAFATDDPVSSPDLPGKSWSLTTLRAEGVPARIATWLCLDEQGQTTPQAQRAQFFVVRSALHSREDIPPAALRHYGQILTLGAEEVLHHTAHLNRQARPPLALFEEWEATERLPPVLVLQLCERALYLGERPDLDEDSSVLHPSLAPLMARIIEQGLAAEVRLATSRESLGYDLADVRDEWWTQLERTLPDPVLSSHLSREAIRLGLLHQQPEVRRLMLQQMTLKTATTATEAESATLSTIAASPPTSLPPTLRRSGQRR